MTDALNTDAQLQISGVLLHDAQVRTIPMGEDSTAMPVQCLVIQADHSCHGPVRAEQVYPPQLRGEADAAAKAMKKGMRVTVRAPIAHLRTTLAMSSHIEIHGRAKAPKTSAKKEPAHAHA